MYLNTWIIWFYINAIVFTTSCLAFFDGHDKRYNKWPYPDYDPWNTDFERNDYPEPKLGPIVSSEESLPGGVAGRGLIGLIDKAFCKVKIKQCKLLYTKKCRKYSAKCRGFYGWLYLNGVKCYLDMSLILDGIKTCPKEPGESTTTTTTTTPRPITERPPPPPPPPSTTKSPTAITDAKCKELGKDVCNCRKSPHCRFDGTGCRAEPKVCGQMKFRERECIQPAHKYAFAGEICRYKGPGQVKCEPLRTIVAVNTAGNDLISSENIEYESGLDFPYEDPLGIVRIWHYKGATGCDKKDCPLYEKFLWGNDQAVSKSTSDQCITYKITILDDGEFQLRFHTLEPSMKEVDARLFNVKFNDIVVFREVDIYALAGKTGESLDLYINFRVSKGQKTLTLNGHSDSAIEGGQIPLSLCFGSCNVASVDFVIGGFAILQMASDNPTDEKCLRIRDNVCECNKNSICKFHAGRETCMSGQSLCSKFNFLESHECSRRGKHYAVAGTTCKNAGSGGGNCGNTKVIHAVDLGKSNGFQASDGIFYKPMQETVVHDPHKFLMFISKDVAYGVPEQDAPLYKTYVLGDSRKITDASGLCMGFEIHKMKSDGGYELILKFLDPSGDDKYKRMFTVKLNDIPILMEFDPIKISGGANYGVDVHVNFKVSDNGQALFLPGHEITPIKNNMLLLSLCFGDCKDGNRNFLLSAFAVIKHLKQGEDDSESSEEKKNECDKRGKDVCSCRGNPGTEDAEYCKFDLEQHRCVKQSDICKEAMETVNKYLGCENYNSFYAFRGELCFSHFLTFQQRSDLAVEDRCRIPNVLTQEANVAINFNGAAESQDDGIQYNAGYELAGLIEDPAGIAVLGSTEYPDADDIAWQQGNDFKFYNGWITGDGRGQPTGICIKIPVKGLKPGKFIINIKIIDVEYRGQPHNRDFSVRFNGQVVAAKIDPNHLVQDVIGFHGGKVESFWDNEGGDPEAVNIYAFLDIERSGDSLFMEMLGHPKIPVKESGAFIDICNGDCKGIKDPAFIVSSIAFVEWNVNNRRGRTSVVKSVTM